jgi:hypothetical protein
MFFSGDSISISQCASTNESECAPTQPITQGGSCCSPTQSIQPSGMDVDVDPNKFEFGSGSGGDSDDDEDAAFIEEANISDTNDDAAASGGAAVGDAWSRSKAIVVAALKNSNIPLAVALKGLPKKQREAKRASLRRIKHQRRDDLIRVGPTVSYSQKHHERLEATTFNEYVQFFAPIINCNLSSIQ